MDYEISTALQYVIGATRGNDGGASDTRQTAAKQTRWSIIIDSEDENRIRSNTTVLRKARKCLKIWKKDTEETVRKERRKSGHYSFSLLRPIRHRAQRDSRADPTGEKVLEIENGETMFINRQ